MADRFPDYEVSTEGRVRRITSRTSGKSGRILTPSLHYRGYLHHGLGSGGKTVTVRLNRLVCEAFHGRPPSDRHQAAHRNGDRLDNRAINLYWATKLENESDKTRHGTRRRGSACSVAKITERDALEIKARAARGERQTALASAYGVSDSLVNAIVSGRAWKHVSL